MDPVLNHTRVTASDSGPERWLYLLHGIYGSGRNWASVARRLVEERPEWGVVLVDLRLHGGSTGFSPPHTLRACVRDLVRLESELESPAAAILGHSFGGKVALLRAAEEGRNPGQVWVADSTLRPGEPSGSAWRIIEIVRGLPDEFASRDEVADALEERGYPRGVGQWLAMNLERTEEGLRWRLDWNGVEEMLRDYFPTDVWPIIEEPPEGTDLHFLKATGSDALDEETMTRLGAAGERTGRVTVHLVEGGHWLNVDNPESVLRLLAEQLPG
jgi:esterase